MASARFESVAEYLASLDPVKEQTLRSVIDIMLAEFPELAVKIAWNVPQIHRDGLNVLGVSSAKKHLALAPWSPEVIEDFRQRLEGDGYVVKKNLFQVPDNWEIDTELVRDLVRARLAEFDSPGGK